MKSSNMPEEKKIIPEVKTTNAFTVPDVPKGKVLVAVMEEGTEKSYFTIPERDYDRAYKNNPKYQLKKKEIK